MRKKVVNILVILSILFFPMMTFAKSLRAELIIDNKSVTKGDSVDVTIKIKDRIDKDVSVFQTVISFDESLFEGIDENSFQEHNGWFDRIYNKDTHALVLINKFGSRLNEEVLSFSLKVKNKIKPTTTSITLKNTVVANKDEEMYIEDVSSKVSLSVPVSELGNTTSEKEFFGKALEGSTVRFYNILVIIVLELIIVTVLVMLYYASKLYIKNSAHRKMIAAGLCIVEAFAIAAMFTYDVRRGDLTGDENVDFTDVELLRNHLVNYQMLSPLKLANADMNKDGLITCQDLAIILSQTMEKYEYMAVLTDSLMESNGYEKGTMVDLRFYADITNGLGIDYVMIDGKKYKAELVDENSKEYTVKMEASTVSKKYNYNLTEVILSTGQSVKVDYKTEVMVLKDIPKITGFATYYNKEESKVNIALTLEDEDNAIVDAKYELVKSNGQVVASGSISNGKNSFTLALENAVSYKFRIIANYNRGADSGEYTGIISDSYDIRIVTDYRLQIGSLALVQNGVNVNNIEKGVNTELTFNSTNVSGYAPKKAMVNGVLYNVSKVSGNKYSVSLPNDVLLQSNNLTISKIILSNGKVILTNSKIAYNVLKKKPVITGVETYEDIMTSKMDLSVNLIDEDKTLTKLVAKLYDSNNTLISEQQIEDGNYKVELPTRDTDRYIVRIYGDYNILNGNGEYTYYNVLLYENNIDAILKAYINSYEVDEIYPDKNSTIKLKYNITSNYNTRVSKLVVNNIIYDASKVGMNAYEVEVDTGEIDGVQSFNTTKIIFENDFEYIADETVKIDVLKDIPIIDNFEIIENKQESKIDVSFDLFDRDNAYISGKLRLVEKETGEVKKEEDVILGKNSASFLLENAVKYDVEVIIDAALDTKELDANSPNTLEGYKLKSIEARIVTDYKLDITNIELFKENSTEPTIYFDKGENIKVEFASTNVTEYVPIKVKIDGVTYDVKTVSGVSRFNLEGYDEEGIKNLKFESIVLSNHVELTVNSTKKIEILKSKPKIDEVVVEEVDSKLQVNFDLLDEDNSISSMKVLVLDDDNEELFNTELSRETSNFTFAHEDKRIFAIKIIASYKLDSNTLEENKNEFTEVDLFNKRFNFDNIELDVEQVTDVLIKLKETGEQIGETPLEFLENVELFNIRVALNDDSEKVYELEKIKTIENTVFFVLKTDSWFKYSQGKWSNKLILEYGVLVDGRVHSKDRKEANEHTE